MTEMTPKQIVDELNKYIVGQQQAKRSVAIALRNRWRSRMLPPEMKDEVIPKNILMIGPTGVGKTEIARRLAKLVNAPFIKVEATKFTEIGYVGRDVESIVRDLVETAVRMVKQDKMLEVNEKARELADEQIINCFCPPAKEPVRNPFELFFSSSTNTSESKPTETPPELQDERKAWRAKLKKGELEEELIEITVEDTTQPPMGMFAGSGMEEMGINLGDMLGNLLPKKTKKRKLTVANARKILIQEEAQKLIDMDQAISSAIQLAENSGIIFIDEIDKVAVRGRGSGPDVSREGVQRDILPIVEGSTVVTKYGPVKTDHILFIAAGAFHISKPSDLIPELQGRFPIRVELASLSKQDFKEILTQPAQALIKQYTALLAADGVNITFCDEAIDELAEIACAINTQTENIGARRLYTVMEKLLEELSFDAPNLEQKDIRIDRAYVQEMLNHIVVNQNLSHYILEFKLTFER